MMTRRASTDLIYWDPQLRLHPRAGEYPTLMLGDGGGVFAGSLKHDGRN